ncbi:MAG: DUF6236 family protein, partial [Ilumatobacter fluminis]
PEEGAMPRLREDLEWLRGEGLYDRAIVRSGLGQGYLSDVEDALLIFADVPEFRFSGSTFPPLADLVRMYLGKLTEEVERLLQELQLCKLGRFGGTVSVHRAVAEVLLSVTARHYAASSSDASRLVVPSTASELSLEHAFGGSGRDSITYLCQQAVFEQVLPVPGDDCSFQDVVDFRRTYDDEVAEFRLAVEGLAREVGSRVDDEVEMLRSTLEQVDVALRRLRRAAEGKGLRLLRGAGVMLLVGGAAHIGLDAGGFQSVVGGMAGTASVELSTWLLRGKPETDPMAFALRAQLAF